MRIQVTYTYKEVKREWVYGTPKKLYWWSDKTKTSVMTKDEFIIFISKCRNYSNLLNNSEYRMRVGDRMINIHEY